MVTYSHFFSGALLLLMCPLSENPGTFVNLSTSMSLYSVTTTSFQFLTLTPFSSVPTATVLMFCILKLNFCNTHSLTVLSVTLSRATSTLIKSFFCAKAQLPQIKSKLLCLTFKVLQPIFSIFSSILPHSYPLPYPCQNTHYSSIFLTTFGCLSRAFAQAIICTWPPLPYTSVYS